MHVPNEQNPNEPEKSPRETKRCIDKGAEPAKFNPDLLDHLEKFMLGMKQIVSLNESAVTNHQYTHKRAEAALKLIGFQRDDVSANGSCYLHSTMSKETYDDEAERVRHVKVMREQIRDYGACHKDEVITFVRHSVAEHRATQRKCELEDLEKAFSYWLNEVVLDSYWLGDFELSVLAVLGECSVVGFWDKSKKEFWIRQTIPGGDEVRFPFSELPARCPDLTHFPVYNDRDHYTRARKFDAAQHAGVRARPFQCTVSIALSDSLL